jgi:hypothetical protein
VRTIEVAGRQLDVPEAEVNKYLAKAITSDQIVAKLQRQAEALERKGAAYDALQTFYAQNQDLAQVARRRMQGEEVKITVAEDGQAEGNGEGPKKDAGVAALERRIEQLAKRLELSDQRHEQASVAAQIETQRKLHPVFAGEAGRELAELLVPSILVARPGTSPDEALSTAASVARRAAEEIAKQALVQRQEQQGLATLQPSSGSPPLVPTERPKYTVDDLKSGKVRKDVRSLRERLFGAPKL